MDEYLKMYEAMMEKKNSIIRKYEQKIKDLMYKADNKHVDKETFLFSALKEAFDRAKYYISDASSSRSVDGFVEYLHDVDETIEVIEKLLA